MSIETILRRRLSQIYTTKRLWFKVAVTVQVSVHAHSYFQPTYRYVLVQYVTKGLYTARVDYVYRYTIYKSKSFRVRLPTSEYEYI
jgi:hypothetical protein